MNSRHSVGVSTKVVAIAVIVILVAAGGAAYLYYQGASKSANNVTLSLGFYAGPENPPQYYALQQGYYSSDGLNVTVLPGTGTAAAITAVSTGQVNFALADASGLVYSLLKSNITNVRIVAVLFPTSFFGIIYNKAAVSNLSDLATTTGAAMNPSIGVSTKLFLALAQQNNLSVASHMQYSTSEPVVEGYLTTGKVDWVVGGAQDVAFLQPSATQEGIQLGFFPLSSMGLQSYGGVLITSTSMIADHSNLVAKFVSATLKGMVQGTLNPVAAADAESHYLPQLNATVMLQGFNMDISCCLTGITSTTNPLVFGYISPTKMQQTVDNVLTGESLNIKLNASSFYTDAYTQAP